jgi:hydroxymethylglutaryl-CoA lyase
VTGRKIEIVEVGPRDGLQNEKVALPVETRLEYIRRLEAAGARRIEAASFVNPKLVPQMAGAEDVMAGLPHEEGRSRIGLALNLRGWDRAVDADCDEVNVSVAATDGFGLKNQGMAVKDQMQMLADIAERAHNMSGARGGGPSLSATISVVWGCPFDGDVSEGQVTAMVKDIAALGYREIGLADTIGVGDPWTVRKRIEAARKAAPDATLRLHFHDTRNTGLANAYAAIEAGVSVLDASNGGLGGCPFAPNATGNIGTEDLVYMLERAGFDTGYDLDRLIETANWIAGHVGHAPTSAVARAGGFPKPRKETAAA